MTKWRLSRRAALGIALVGLVASVAYGIVQQAEPLREGFRYYSVEPADERGKPEPQPWESLVGKRVQVEGLAWGFLEKGLGPYVVLENGKVYVQRALDDKMEALAGRVVRVTGTLAKQRQSKAAPGAAGFAEDFFVYTLVNAEVTKLEKAEWPWLRPAGDNASPAK